VLFTTPQYNERGKVFCHNEKVNTETKYFKFHENSVTHLSVQGINIIALKKAVFENCQYDAENGEQSQRVIHNFFRKTSQISSLKKCINMQKLKKF